MNPTDTLRDIARCVRTALVDSSTPVFVAGACCGVLCGAALLLMLSAALQ